MSKFKLQDLPYDYDALEPHIDKETVKIHHDLHHQTYVNKLNDALEALEKYKDWDLEKLLIQKEMLPFKLKEAVEKHGGGVYNHNLYFSLMKKGVKRSKEIEEAISKDFGSFEKFKEQFTKAALSVFGSGWVWLVKNKEGKLEIMTTPNQITPPIGEVKPILNLDVWEHAYYLKYQNKRKKYVEEWFKVINWEKVEKLY